MNLTPAAPPIFLTPNYLKDSLNTSTSVRITTSSMQALADRIADMDPYATWNSMGSDDTTNPQSIGIGLYVNSTQILRTDIACISLLNMNFKDFTISLSSDNGATFTDVYTVTNNVERNYILDTSAAVKTANYILIVATTTFASTPNVEKFLGTVVVAGLLRQMTASPNMPMTRGSVENIKVLVMANGSKNITYVKRSVASFEFYTATLSFSNATDYELTAMREMRRDNTSFIFVPEPGDKQGDMYWCIFAPGSFKSSLSNKIKSYGNEIEFGVQEIG